MNCTNKLVQISLYFATTVMRFQKYSSTLFGVGDFSTPKLCYDLELMVLSSILSGI